MRFFKLLGQLFVGMMFLAGVGHFLEGNFAIAGNYYTVAIGGYLLYELKKVQKQLKELESNGRE